MAELSTALALAIALEGIFYALFPGTMRQLILRVLEMPDSVLRISGLAAAITAVAAIAIIRSFFPSSGL